jgi:hypothetical protein
MWAFVANGSGLRFGERIERKVDEFCPRNALSKPTRIRAATATVPTCPTLVMRKIIKPFFVSVIQLTYLHINQANSPSAKT